MNKRAVVTVAFMGAILVSALSVIYTSHVSRQLFSEWQHLNKEAYRLDEEWGRLLLERSTWASHDRIEQLANKKLKMVAPQGEALQLVKKRG